jgi:hypothetical protein
MKPLKSIRRLFVCLAGYEMARKAAADRMRDARHWAKRLTPERYEKRAIYAFDAASSSGWWKRTSEEWRLEILKCWET